MVSRRFIQTILGLMWFIDGVLQLKPPMFTTAFLKQVILPTSQSQPAWIASLVQFGAHLVAVHIEVWNTCFAVIQIVIGLGFMLNVKLRWTILASLIWTLIVWAFGEGFGQLLTGQTLLLNGAPGAVLLYGLIGIVLWPKERQSPEDWPESSVAFARNALGVLWIAGCALHFQSTYLTATGFTQAISAQWLAHIIGRSGLVISILLGVVEFLIGTLLLLNVQVRSAVWISMIVSFLYWWIGQSFGEIFTPLSTDFNSGPLFIVLSICACPSLRRGFGSLTQKPYRRDRGDGSYGRMEMTLVNQ
ncbi:MAG: hypothetical protein K6T83_02505 [Alicyclobacillus sp.]|nr:hypothetical protein [Alicyclobacillus sp.]